MAGGKVDGILRFSIQWNDEDFCPNDYDAHCRLPDGREIYFHERLDRVTLGELDIDIIHPQRGTPAVENIVWPSMTNMKPGTYLMYVHCYTNSGGRSGFKAEVEFDGTIHSFEYKKELRRDEIVKVAEVTYDPATGFTIKDLIPPLCPHGIFGGSRATSSFPSLLSCIRPTTGTSRTASVIGTTFSCSRTVSIPSDPMASTTSS